MQKLSQKAIQKINEINKNMTALRTQYDASVAAVNQKYGKCVQNFVHSKHTNSDPVANSNWEYEFEISQLHLKFMRRMNYNSARKAAIMLIDYNIARPNKPLHEGTVLSKTSNLGENGKFIRQQMYKSYYDYDIPRQSADLHDILEKEYNVLLLDYNLYCMTLNAISFMSEYDFQIPGGQELLNEYERVLSMFRPGIIKRAIQEHRLQQMKTH